jgi:threonine/homoserine/homoserine lactone efflux protein
MGLYALKIVGALYLMYLAWRLWKQAADPVLPFSDPHHDTAHQGTVRQISPTEGAIGGSKRIWSLTVLRSHFVHGVLINLTNPKSVMFAAVVLIVVFPPNLGLAEKAFIVGNHLALEWVFYFCLTWLVSRPAVTRRYLKAKQLFDRCAAGVMAALGLRLLLSPR